MSTLPVTICLSAPKGSLAPYVASVLYWAVNQNQPEPNFHIGINKIQNPSFYHYPREYETPYGFDNLDWHDITMPDVSHVIWSDFDSSVLNDTFDTSGPPLGPGRALHISIEPEYPRDSMKLGYNAVVNEAWRTFSELKDGPTRFINEFAWCIDHTERAIPGYMMDESGILEWPRRLIDPMCAEDLAVQMLCSNVGRFYCKIISNQGYSNPVADCLHLSLDDVYDPAGLTSKLVGFLQDKLVVSPQDLQAQFELMLGSFNHPITT